MHCSLQKDYHNCSVHFFYISIRALYVVYLLDTFSNKYLLILQVLCQHLFIIQHTDIQSDFFSHYNVMSSPKPKKSKNRLSRSFHLFPKYFNISFVNLAPYLKKYTFKHFLRENYIFISCTKIHKINKKYFSFSFSFFFFSPSFRLHQAKMSFALYFSLSS